MLLDIKGTFDNLQRPAISLAMEEASIAGKLQGFIEAFLTGAGRQRPVSAPASGRGHPAGLSQPLPAALPDCRTSGGTHRVYRSAYADDVALWALVPKGSCRGVVLQLQAALDAVRPKLANVGLQL